MGKQLFTEGKQFCVLTMGFFNPSLETAPLKKNVSEKNLQEIPWSESLF